MSHFVPKHEMTEEDIKLQFITPAIMAKWPTNRITMETKITDGKINLRGMQRRVHLSWRFFAMLRRRIAPSS